MPKVNVNRGTAAAVVVARSCGCNGTMVPLVVGTRLSVHLPDASPEEFWTATPLDAWTCTDCGKTELFARHPRIFKR